MVIWITGLPGSGKTTVAKALYQELMNMQQQVVLLDGDALREALNNKQYENSARKELALTYSRLAKMHSQQGQTVICATVSMFDEVRDWNRQHIDDYLEVYLEVSKEVLLERNQKGLYSKAEQGLVQNMLGFDLDFEAPKQPDLVFNNNGQLTPKQIIEKIVTSYSTKFKESQL